MTKSVAYRYRVYDFRFDDYVVSTRMATRSKIKQIGGEIIPGTKTEIDEKHLLNGWTSKGFFEVDETMYHPRSGQRAAVSRLSDPIPKRAPTLRPIDEAPAPASWGFCLSTQFHPSLNHLNGNSQLMAVMVDRAHWRCARHALNWLQQKVEHAA